MTVKADRAFCLTFLEPLCHPEQYNEQFRSKQLKFVDPQGNLRVNPGHLVNSLARHMLVSEAIFNGTTGHIHI